MRLVLLLGLPPLALGLPLALLVFAGGVLWHALRGRRVDDHPHCRRCGFDLFGRPVDSIRCGECGADLSRPRALRVGRRRRVRGLLWVAGPALLLSAGWLGAAGWVAHRGVGWQRYMPAWVLLRETGSPAPAARDAALAELRRRLAAGELPDKQVADAADRALAYQADASKPWVPAWGAVLEDARDAGKLSDERWARYARQAVGVRLRVRPAVRPGDVLCVRIEPGGDRVGPRVPFVAAYLVSKQYGVSGRPAVDPRRDPNLKPLYVPKRILSTGEGWEGGRVLVRPDTLLSTDDAGPAGLAPGPQTVTFPVRVRVFKDLPDANGGIAALADVDFELTAGWTLLPADAPPVVTLVHDPSRRAGVEKAIALWSPEKSGIAWIWNLGPPPVGLGYEVYVRSGGVEEPFGRFATRAGRPDGIALDGFGKHPRLSQADRVDVIFRPSVSAALQTVDVTEVWDGEVVKKDVTVLEENWMFRQTRRDSGAAPATEPAGAGFGPPAGTDGAGP